MDIKIDKTKEYAFIEALEKGIDNRNLIITSKITGYNYKIDISEKYNKLKFYNPVITNWQSCTYVLPEEIFSPWYITRMESVEHGRMAN